MVVRIHGKAYELVSKAEAKALLKQQLQSAVEELKNEIANSLTDEIRKAVISDVQVNLRCTTSWTNYQAQSRDFIKYLSRKVWILWWAYYAPAIKQHYANSTYSCPTSLNIHYKNVVRKVLT